MDDINHEILKFVKSKVDKIHYLMAFRYFRYLRPCGEEINQLSIPELERLDKTLLVYLFSYMTVDTINKLLAFTNETDKTSNYYLVHYYQRNTPLEFIELAVAKYNENVELNWSEISHQNTLTPQFIEKNKDTLNWYALSEYVINLPLDLFLEHIDTTTEEDVHYKWENISNYNCTLTADFVETHRTLINWEKLCKNPYITFTDEWWLKNINTCKYFIFYRNLFHKKTRFSKITRFLEICIKLTFNLLIADSVKSMTKVQKFDYFLQNILRSLYFATSDSKSLMIKTVHNFLKFAIIDQNHNMNYLLKYDYKHGSAFGAGSAKRGSSKTMKNVKKNAKRHLKNLKSFNLGKELTIDLILQFKWIDAFNHF